VIKGSEMPNCIGSVPPPNIAGRFYQTRFILGALSCILDNGIAGMLSRAITSVGRVVYPSTPGDRAERGHPSHVARRA